MLLLTKNARWISCNFLQMQRSCDRALALGTKNDVSVDLDLHGYPPTQKSVFPEKLGGVLPHPLIEFYKQKHEI